ncbi:MAG: 4Fe-4S dicluster domain-containing protein [Candidatus Thorarchaeota archaeon]
MNTISQEILAMTQRYYLDVDYLECCGCKLCEEACAVLRGGGIVSPGTARIRVEVRPTTGADIPLVCQHCEDPPCMVCPVGAMSINEMGVVIIDEDKCIGCRQCVQACPFGAIQMHPVTRKAIKCDLCGGHPKCVEVCKKAHPPGVIHFVKAEDAGKFNRDRWADRLEQSITRAMKLTGSAISGALEGAAADLAAQAERGEVG